MGDSERLWRRLFGTCVAGVVGSSEGRVAGSAWRAGALAAARANVGVHVATPSGSLAPSDGSPSALQQMAAVVCELARQGFFVAPRSAVLQLLRWVGAPPESEDDVVFDALSEACTSGPVTGERATYAILFGEEGAADAALTEEGAP